MAKKNSGRSQKRRSERKVLDAFHLAERVENGSGSDSEADDLRVKDGIMDASKFMRNQDDDVFEDEELDSDEALASDDDFDVLSSKFSQTIRDKNKKKRHDTNSSSDESSGDEGYHSIDENHLVTLSEAWTMDDNDLAASRGQKDVVLDDTWDTESSEEGSESSNDSGSVSDSDCESESEDDEVILRGSGSDSEAELATTVSRINAAVKKPQHKKLVAETVSENEFNVPTRGNKLSLAEMMAVGDTAVAPLVTHDEASTESGVLAVPLPKRIQERNNRKVAYEITKQDVAKWQESVRTLQEADHLEFPLAKPVSECDSDDEKAYENLQLVPEPTDKTELSLKVDKLLKEGALLDERNEATFEQLASAKLSKDDLFKRTQELRRMRELMFRDEQRAKRIKKIKSKQFRKIRKRERLRDTDLVEDAGEEEYSPEDHDLNRAEERMSLRHKTQSKWAKNMIRSGITKDASTRAELEEMLRTGERLRSRQIGYNEGEQSDSGVSDIEKEYEKDDSVAENAERSRLGKGVLAMDFMKAAEERTRKENQREIQLSREMNQGGIEQFENQEKHSINEQKNQGRRVYAPAAVDTRQNLEDVEEDTLRDFRDDDAKSLINRLSTKERRKGKKENAEDYLNLDEPVLKKTRIEEQEFKGFDEVNGDDKRFNSLEAESETDNPWLTNSDPLIHKSKKFSTITEDSSKLDKAAHKIAKRHGKHISPKLKVSDTYIDLDHVMTISGNNSRGVDEEDAADTRMFRQQNLIKEAFAGDDVVSEFLQEKRQIEEEEDDKEEDVTLPGWGGWGGADLKAKPKKKFVRKIDGVAQKDKRKDKGLDNVIVNETVNKHNLKYQSSSVPFPYESKEQYERALRMPIGEEWASRATHVKTILPSVTVKQGMVIDPLKAPFK